MVCLQTLPVAQPACVYYSVIKLVANNEKRIMWKEGLVAYFKVLSQNFARWNLQRPQIVNQNGRSGPKFEIGASRVLAIDMVSLNSKATYFLFLIAFWTVLYVSSKPAFEVCSFYFLSFREIT